MIIIIIIVVVEIVIITDNMMMVITINQPIFCVLGARQRASRQDTDRVRTNRQSQDQQRYEGIMS